MRIINVIPLTRNIVGKETLSYFSARDIPTGSIVDIPLRKKYVRALVVSSENVSKAKSKIKQADFAMRKIEAQKPLSIISHHCVNAAIKTAKYFAQNTGSVLYNTIPTAILEDAELTQTKISKKQKAKEVLHEKVVLQSPKKERFETYKSFIREEFARNASVYVCVPTVVETQYACEQLQKGIEHHTFLLHGSLSKKEKQKRWKEAVHSKHPVLIITTPRFLSLPRNDIQTIILEQENSSAYKTLSRPYYDQRIFAEFLARECGARIVFAGLPLRIETLWRFKQGELEDFVPLNLRAPESKIQNTVIDMREKKETPEETTKKKVFRILHPQIIKILKGLTKSKGRVFLYTTRRGLSSTTVCNDCGDVVICEICNAPVVLHKSSKENIFTCHVCGTSRSAKECCKTCTGWRLISLGIGTERLYDEVRKYISKENIFTIDRDTTTTQKQAQKVAGKFYKTDGGVLIGTEMALRFIQEPVEHTVVVSIDSLLLLPEWKIGERLFAILLTIKHTATKTFFIQTRKPTYPVLEYVQRGSFNEFYKEEIDARKAFNYPPFSVLIKISVAGSLERVTNEMEKLEILLEEYAFHAYRPATAIKGGYILHGLIRLPKDKWPNDQLLTFLRTLPPHFNVVVDPDSLF